MWAIDVEDRYAQQHLQISGHYLYVAQCGLTIFDLAHPEKLTVVGDYPDKCGVDAFAIVDGRAYLAARDQGITVLDITTPAVPRFVGRHLFSTGATSPPFGLVVRSNCIYLYTPSSKLPPGHIAQANVEATMDTGWYMENPVWQVLKLNDQGATVGLEPIQAVAGIGRPRTSIGNYLYAATNWTESGNGFNTSLQTVALEANCRMKVVNTQIVPAVINDMDTFETILFGSVGNVVWAWDITDPQRPSKLDVSYKVSGRIGDFITIDVDESIVLGRGYSLKYSRGANQVRFHLYTRLAGGSGACTVWMQPEQPCKSQGDNRYRGVETGRGSVLYKNYVFYPYNIATNPLTEDGFVLVDYAIMTYKLP